MAGFVTSIPGIKTVEIVITDEMRKEGDRRALELAIAQLTNEYYLLTECWPIGKHAKIRVALTIDHPPTTGRR